MWMWHVEFHGLGHSKHALLRPSEQRLYLIDLSSNNGTKHNQLPVGTGVAVVLQDHDTISLGHLTFEIHILNHPAPPSTDRQAMPPREGDTRPFS
jgi:predicted component of type VI protein secretion system